MQIYSGILDLLRPIHDLLCSIAHVFPENTFLIYFTEITILKSSNAQSQTMIEIKKKQKERCQSKPGICSLPKL